MLFYNISHFLALLRLNTVLGGGVCGLLAGERGETGCIL